MPPAGATQRNAGLPWKRMWPLAKVAGRKVPDVEAKPDIAKPFQPSPGALPGTAQTLHRALPAPLDD